MAARRSVSLCLLCQTRQSLIGRRRLSTTAKQWLETATIQSEDDSFVLGNGNEESEKEGGDGGPVLLVNETIHQWRLQSRVDELREARLGFDELYKRKDMRLEVLRNLSNPWPPTQHTGGMHKDKSVKLELPEANAAPVPHTIFRQRIREATLDKEIRKILRLQLLRCEWPSEILRIVAVAMQSRSTAKSLSVLSDPIVRALYRCRNNASDPEVLKLLNIIVSRFQIENFNVDPAFVQMGLKFAARSRSLVAMKRYLKLLRQMGCGMTSAVFRSVIAKFSIGHRGLGEIRNGRWRRDQLMQVLEGFDDAKDLPADQQYHLGSFLKRHDWQYLHGYVAVLARCKDSEAVWREWELWKRSPARTKPKKLESQGQSMTSRKRGDYWFAEQITLSGDYEKAWKLIAEIGLPFKTLKDRVKTRLLDGIQYATIWDEDIQNEMLRKYDADLMEIEKALGVRWVPNPDAEGEGTHENARDQEDALEMLSADNWKLDQEYGFPYPDYESIVPEPEERALHNAEERELADGESQT